MKNIAIAFILLFSLVTFGQTKKPKVVKEKEEKIVEIKANSYDDIMMDVAPVEPGPTLQENPIYQPSDVEMKPEFPGGLKSFESFLSKNIVISDAMKSEKISGKVYVSFIIDNEGSISDIKVIRDLGLGSGNEAVRVLKRMPKWIPAQRNGKKVKCSYTIPIRFDGTITAK